MFISILYMFRAVMCPSSGELYQHDIWYMSLCTDDRLVYRFGWDCSLIQTCTLKGHLYRVTYTRCVDTINSPDDGHMAARNMLRIEINIYEKELCVKLVIYKDCTEMLHGQQNIKFRYVLFRKHIK